MSDVVLDFELYFLEGHATGGDCVDSVNCYTVGCSNRHGQPL